MPKRTTRRTAGKAAETGRKPRHDFPLFPHRAGQWAKKVRGRLHYFGSVRADPDGSAALERWLDVKDDLLAGRTPRPKAEGLSLADLCNRFLAAKRLMVDSGELAPRSWGDYHATAATLVGIFGRRRLVVDLDAEDFARLRAALAKTRGPVVVGNEVQRIRSVFKWGYEAGLLDRPVRFGPGFKRPAKRVLRLERAKRGTRMFEAGDIRRMIEAATLPLRAMILLGVNCGFGNADCGKLPLSALDLDGGWIDFPRPKTGIPRRCPLWPETVAALREWLSQRPRPAREASELVFVTKRGLGWWKPTSDNPIAKEFRKLVDALGMYRRGLTFYALRHTFETIGGDARDQVAVDHIMGHARDDMASVYRERIADERLRDVVNHVRRWLFGGG